jgi:hypothetical protein
VKKIIVLIWVVMFTMIITSCATNISKQGGSGMKNYGEKLINDKGEDPVLDILEVINNKCNYGENLDELTNGERIIYYVGELEGEINNGGFSQYFFNSSGQNAKEAINALKTINAEYTASLLEQALAIYKNGPTNDGRNDPEEDELTEKQEEKLNELDDKFYEYNDNLSELQIIYIKNHKEEF